MIFVFLQLPMQPSRSSLWRLCGFSSHVTYLTLNRRAVPFVNRPWICIKHVGTQFLLNKAGYFLWYEVKQIFEVLVILSSSLSTWQESPCFWVPYLYGKGIYTHMALFCDVAAVPILCSFNILFIIFSLIMNAPYRQHAPCRHIFFLHGQITLASWGSLGNS